MASTSALIFKKIAIIFFPLIILLILAYTTWGYFENRNSTIELLKSDLKALGNTAVTFMDAEVIKSIKNSDDYDSEKYKNLARLLLKILSRMKPLRLSTRIFI